jgi:hypothetical protein
MAIYPTIEDLIKIHGHGGHTEVVWDDEAAAKAKVTSSRGYFPDLS